MENKIQALTDKITELNAQIGALQNENNRTIAELQARQKEWKMAEAEYIRMQNYLVDELTNRKKIPCSMIENKNEVAIIIITYNQSQLIKKQVELIRRFCKDAADIIIVDNSTDTDVIAAIQYYNNTSLNCKYYKTYATSKNGSDSHSFAANVSYFKFKDDYRYLFFIDHDNFPTRDFSIKEILKDKVMAGLGQQPKDTMYMWAGCVMFDLFGIEPELIDFSTNHDLQIDTGGMLYKIIDKYGEKCVFFNEIHVQNPNFNKSFYNFFAEINNGMFMHFINGSGWNSSEGNEERINSLLNILEEKITKDVQA